MKKLAFVLFLVGLVGCTHSDGKYSKSTIDLSYLETTPANFVPLKAGDLEKFDPKRSVSLPDAVFKFFQDSFAKDFEGIIEKEKRDKIKNHWFSKKIKENPQGYYGPVFELENPSKTKRIFVGEVEQADLKEWATPDWWMVLYDTTTATCSTLPNHYGHWHGPAWEDIDQDGVPEMRVDYRIKSGNCGAGIARFYRVGDGKEFKEVFGFITGVGCGVSYRSKIVAKSHGKITILTKNTPTIHAPRNNKTEKIVLNLADYTPVQEPGF